jgi:hypothetical protein
VYVLRRSKREVREARLRDALLEVVSDAQAVQQLQTSKIKHYVFKKICFNLI